MIGDFSFFGKILIGLGLLMIVMGVLFVAGTKLLNLGRLPGDIFFQRGNFTFAFPIMTSLIISVILTLILNFLVRR
ncbi:MAG: DUF2905 domain-containing protein [Bacillota bacterium]|nr:DUF2905 domain-containing protein [Bacillota bacterium]